DENVGQLRVAAVLLHDEKRRRLLPAAIAARRLRRRQALDQPLREHASARGLERLRERVDGLGADQDVPLRGVPVARAAAGPVMAFRSREGGRAPAGVDYAELPRLASVIGLGQAPDDLVGGEA